MKALSCLISSRCKEIYPAQPIRNEDAPLQIYSSALIFAQRRALFGKTFSVECLAGYVGYRKFMQIGLAFHRPSRVTGPGSHLSRTARRQAAGISIIDKTVRLGYSYGSIIVEISRAIVLGLLRCILSQRQAASVGIKWQDRPAMDAATGAVRQTLRVIRPFHCVVFSPDGKSVGIGVYWQACASGT